MSDYDERQDITGELWFVGELLAGQGLTEVARKCQDTALKVRDEEMSLTAGMRWLGVFENQLD